MFILLSQGSVNQKAREHSRGRKIKDRGESAGVEAARDLQCETHEARGAVMAKHGILCSPTHQLVYFVFGCLSFIEFSCLSRSQCLYASEPGSK